jgi:hypothetical protein
MGFWDDYASLSVIRLIFLGNMADSWLDEQYSSWDDGMIQATQGHPTLRYPSINTVTIQICGTHAPVQSDISMIP